MRGYGDSDKPGGTEDYDVRALLRRILRPSSTVRQINFGQSKPLFLMAHDMGAHPVLLWSADHPEEIARLVYIEVPTNSSLP